MSTPGLQAISAAAQQNARSFPRYLPKTVYLGDGAGNLAVPGGQSQRLCYYYQIAPGGGQRPPGQAPLWTGGGIPYITTLPTGSAPVEVFLGYPPHSDTIHIMSQTPTGIQQTGGVTITEQITSQANFPSIQSVQEFRVAVSNIANLNEVYVNAATYTKPSDGSRQQWSGGLSSGLQTAISALTGTGKQQIAWITFDTAGTGVHVETPVAAAIPIGSLPSRAEYSDATILAMITTYSKDIPAYLYDGQTLAEADIYRRLDSRVDWFGGGAGGSFYQTVEANDVAQTQRGALDLKAGTNVTLTPTDNSGANRTEVLIDVAGVGYTQGCRVYNSTNQAVAAATFVTLTFDSENYDTDTMHDPGTNPSRITIKTAGVYDISGYTELTSGAGDVYANFSVNGSVSICQQTTSGLTSFNTRINLSTKYKFSVNDYVEFVVYQTVGSINSIANKNSFEAQRIG